MSDTPKSFRELARELLSSTFPRGTGMSAAEKWQIKRIAEEIYALADEWERFLREKDTNCSRIVLNQYCLLGEDRR